MRHRLGRYLVVIAFPVKHTRKRSWRERLFCRPLWEKWEITWHETMKDGEVFVDDRAGHIYVNAATAKLLDENCGTEEVEQWKI